MKTMNAESYYYMNLLMKGTILNIFSSLIIKPTEVCSFINSVLKNRQTLTSRICFKYFIGTFLNVYFIDMLLASEDTLHQTFRY